MHWLARSDSLKQQRDPHAATDAECRETALCFTSFHLVQQRRRDAHAGATNWMSERNRTAVDVQTIRIELQFAIAGNDLSSERFVQFNQIDFHQRKLLPLKQRSRRRHRTNAHYFG